MAELDASLVFPKEGVTTTVRVELEGEGLYRLREHPPFVESASYGDLVRGIELDDGSVEFVAVVERSKLVGVHGLMSREQIDSPALSAVLSRVLESGGYWQRDFGGYLSVFFDPERYDPRPELEGTP